MRISGVNAHICVMLFSQVPGHKHLKERLVDSARKHEVAHAQLFYEQKTAAALPLALAYARFLLCEAPSELDSCGGCSSCKQIDGLAHPDLHFSMPVVQIEDEGNDCDSFLPLWRTVFLKNPFLDHTDWQRAFDEKKKPILSKKESERIWKLVKLKSFRSAYRVVILWQPELLNHQSSNYLLKLLEEPEPGTVFLLVTEEVKGVLATIQSRCQVHALPGLRRDEIAEVLVEKYRLDEHHAKLVAQFSENQLSHAIRLAQANVSLETFAGLFVQWTRHCFRRDILELVKWIQEVAAFNRTEQEGFLKFCAFVFREGLSEKYLQTGFEHPSFKSTDFKMSGFARLLHPANLTIILSAIDMAVLEIGRNLNAKMVFYALSVSAMQALHLKEEVV